MSMNHCLALIVSAIGCVVFCASFVVFATDWIDSAPVLSHAFHFAIQHVRMTRKLRKSLDQQLATSVWQSTFARLLESKYCARVGDVLARWSRRKDRRGRRRGPGGVSGFGQNRFGVHSDVQRRNPREASCTNNAWPADGQPCTGIQIFDRYDEVNYHERNHWIILHNAVEISLNSSKNSKIRTATSDDP